MIEQCRDTGSISGYRQGPRYAALTWDTNGILESVLPARMPSILRQVAQADRKRQDYLSVPGNDSRSRRLVRARSHKIVAVNGRSASLS